MPRGCCLILSSTTPSCESLRFRSWETSIRHLSEYMPIVYLFAQSENETRIPNHPNVYKIIANCADYYEDIPLKVYYGFQYLSCMDFDFIVKLDETIDIRNVPDFVHMIHDETKIHDYISLKSVVSPENQTDLLSLQSYHTQKVHDLRFRHLMLPVVHFHYAQGSAYVISRKAYTALRKDYFQMSLYEDYALGMNMHMLNIPLTKSRIHGSDLISNTDTSTNNPIDGIHITGSKYYEELSHVCKTIPSKQTLVIIILGGLGNQLFQLATAMAHCLRNDMNLLLCENLQNVRHFYWNTLLPAFESRLITALPDFPRYNDMGMAYLPLHVQGNCIVKGYFQSSKHFPMYKTSLRGLFSFPKDIAKNLKEKYGDILNARSVVVHARRGDYVPLAPFHGLLPVTYYEKATQIIKESEPDPIFILISDDMDFWKSSSMFKDVSCVYLNESDIISFYVLMNASYIIMANSTFSWWGAYLSHAKKVIAPAMWFGPDGPKETNDIYEADWIKI